MIKEEKFNQYGELGLVPKAITIHNTGTDYTIDEIYDYLDNGTSSNGCHFLINDEKIIEIMPLDWKVYHTGKGRDWAFHNSIAIEICSNLDNDKYFKGQEKAIELIKELLEVYDLTTDDIYFHNDFNSKTYCPKNILDFYGNRQNFIRKEFYKNV